MFRQEIQLIAPQRRIYIDESGVDEDIYRPYVRKKRGKRVYCNISGKKKQRISIIAAYSEKSLKAPFRFEGYTNTLVFNTWLEECLVPELEEGKVTQLLPVKPVV